ncbi:hypothetical protein AB0L88_14380 [Saccharopolyspora shandongensis]|uniref:hypothetical protein n=1 Tax=Saccharopolyspora shandongensis TaxID=418495 RepID=UPI00341954E5
MISDEPYALNTLRIAAAEPRPCGIVTVRMVTEGFDCPQVSTIAYASNVVAPLFISQMMARAMRLTPTERRTGEAFPAKILIPDHPALQAAFMTAIRETIPLTDDTDAFEHNKTHEAGQTPRYDLLGIDDPQLRWVNALDQDDGLVSAEDLATAKAICTTLHIPTVHAPRVALGIRRAPPPQ